MRTSALRITGTLAVCVMALLLSSCSSNNTGKIVGKWKVISSDYEGMHKLIVGGGGTMAWEFRPDGTFEISFVPVHDNNPGSQTVAQAMNSNLQGKEVSGRYTLGAGDRVDFSGAKDVMKGTQATGSISINVDIMTMKDSKNTMMLTRMK